jgi:hypothetical protein
MRSLRSPIRGDPEMTRNFTFLVNPALGGGAAPQPGALSIVC